MANRSSQTPDAKDVFARMGFSDAATVQEPQEDVRAPAPVLQDTKPIGKRKQQKARVGYGKQQPAPTTGFVHKSYYVTPEQHLALRQMALDDQRFDVSGHLRRALNQYLGLPDEEKPKFPY